MEPKLGLIQEGTGEIKKDQDVLVKSLDSRIMNRFHYLNLPSPELFPVVLLQ